jgi:CheY-like chemotaxis protein
MATILIVDDHVLNREFLMTLLSYGGHRLLEAANGAEGLKMVLAEKPDLVISDILMPNMDGYEFVTRMHAHAETADVPVISTPPPTASARPWRWRNRAACAGCCPSRPTRK